MAKLVLLLVALLVACSSPDDGCPAPLTSTEAEARQAVAAICQEHGAVCEARQSIFPGETDFGVVYWSPVRCVEDLRLCAFVVRHEIGHIRLGPSEGDADCWASANSKPVEVDAAICFFESTIGLGDETHGSGPERAAQIRACVEQ